jgi:hypothetical protein
MEKYYIELTSPGGKVSSLNHGGNLSWSRGHCYKLVKECVELPHFAGYSFKVLPE